MDDKLSILWASDGSEASLASADVIRAFLAPVANRILVVTVAPHEGSKFLLQNALNLSLPQSKQAIVDAESAAERTMSALGEFDGSIDKLVVWGIASHEIIKAAGEQGADIIVLGVKPNDAVRRMVLGDTGLRVLQLTSASVLLTRPRLPSQTESVVLLCDDVQHFQAAVAAIRRLHLKGEVRIHLVGFLQPPRLSPGVLPSFSEYDRHRQEVAQVARRSALEALFADAEQALAEPGRSVRELIVEDNVDAGLEKLVRDVQASLIVMGAGPFGTPSYSSTAVATRLAMQVTCSVLVAR
jgi:nucleotide-binding universal stress UspA family protein